LRQQGVALARSPKNQCAQTSGAKSTKRFPAALDAARAYTAKGQSPLTNIKIPPPDDQLSSGRAPDHKKERPMKIALLMLLLVATASPVLAGPHRANRAEPSTMTCETVRAYVSQVGLATATAIARANGMTAVQERKARQCLASRRG
jgi:hypothetical protein